MTALQSAPPAGDTAAVSRSSEIGSREEQLARMGQAFHQELVLYDTATGKILNASVETAPVQLHNHASLCDHVAQTGDAEVIEDFAPLLAVALPLWDDGYFDTTVAVGLFCTEPIQTASELSAAAKTLGMTTNEAFAWAKKRPVWPTQAVVSLSQALVENARQAVRIDVLQQQTADVSTHLLSTFEELDLLHRLIDQLTVTSSNAELHRNAVQWLSEVTQAESLAIIHPQDSPEDRLSMVDSADTCPLDLEQLHQLVEELGDEGRVRCVLLDEATLNRSAWAQHGVRQLACVPIRSSSSFHGWLVAVNHQQGIAFADVEAGLLGSVATMLGIHAGNSRLFSQQQVLFSAVVKAFTSAIDAKDPYTCGHSDRVARLAVCLAQEMGCNAEEQNTIYLGGLLHDIGKIGIQDQVLSKPGKLTDEEYDHIKTHPELGYRILNEVQQLEAVLPIVLYHHEAWNGKGYPAKLKGDECPKLARIVAVADAIDAMSSDRPYRPGMEDDKLDQILRDGSGEQWDSEVINAVFRVRDQIREIGQLDRDPMMLDVSQWCG